MRVDCEWFHTVGVWGICSKCTYCIFFCLQEAAELFLLGMVAVQQGIGLLQGHTLANVGGKRTGHALIGQRGTSPSGGAGLLFLHYH